MAEFRVRFVGDLGNLAAFNSAIRNSLSQNAATLERANSQVVSRALGEAVRPASQARGAGLFVRNASTEIDRLNNSFIQSGTVIRRYADGFTTEMRKVRDAATGLEFEKAFVRPTFGEAYHSDFRKAIGNVEAYERSIARLAPVEKQMINLEGQAARQIADIRNAQAQLGTYANLPVGKQTPEQREAIFRNINRLVPGALASPDDLEVVKGSGVGIGQTVADIQQRLTTQRVEIQRSLRDNLNALQNDPVVRQISQEAFFAATSPEGRIGREAVNVLNRYPALRRDLEQKAGLGGGNRFTLADGKTLNPAYAIAAQAKDFEISNVYRDMERGLIRVSGAIRGTDGIMSQFSYTIDKNNNVVNTWGRNLRGAGGFLNQTGRDLVKVIEYSAAAAVVFGSLGLAFAGLSTINTLNVDLQRFAITARLSGDELTTMFEGLSQVAFQTATPIAELVKAADDMALATRRANQTTQEWQASILELANAVGILTNISGLDTVRATEILVASMKQLNLETSELVPLLSQITAAAGGQSASITDIASALAVLAEAAEGALIPLEGQIAAVQVISQVTGKSAEQTANAFKNLFGAINADSSVAKLEEFGIAVRDSEGNLRPFLEIYREIADAINTGIIPEGRINEVLRAISGGRTGRQADAAALVSNIYRVFEVQGIAATASNEALIANAKILDTNQAKITQFQNALNIAVFEKFNEVVSDLTVTLADLGSIFANVFGLIPTQAITATIEILALVAAVKLLSRAGAALNLGGLFTGIKNNLAGTPRIIEGLAEHTVVPPVVPGNRLASLLTPIQQDIYLRNLETRTQIGNLSDRIKRANIPSPSYDLFDPQDLRTNLGLRTPVTSVPYVSPFAVIRDPISAPFGDPDLTTRYRTSPYQHRNLFGPIQYIRTLPELTRDDVRHSLIAPAGRFEPGTNLNQLEVARRAGFPIKMDSETKSTLSRFLGVFNNRAGRFAGGAAIGGAAAIAGGGTGLSGLAQLAGSALLFTPAAPIGAGLLIGGAIADQFSQQAEEAKAKAADLQSTLYNLTLQWKQDNAAVSAAQETYGKIQESLDGVAIGTDKYISLQSRLGEASVELALALDAQASSTQEIINKIAELNTLTGGKNAGLSAFAQGLAGQQNLSEADIRQLVGIVSEQILAASGQPVFRPTITDFSNLQLNNVQPTEDNIRLFAGYDRRGQRRFDEVTPIEFTLDPNLFNRLIPNFDQRREFTAEDFPFQNPAAVAAFLSAAEQRRQTLPVDQQQAFLTNVIDPFREAVLQFGVSSSQLAVATQNTRAEVEARSLLGLLTGPARDSEGRAIAGLTATDAAQANLAAVDRLQSVLNDPRAFRQEDQLDERPGRFTRNVPEIEISEIISQLLADSLTGTFNADTLRSASQTIVDSFGLEFESDIAETTAQAAILRDVFHLTDEEITKVLGNIGNLKPAITEAIEAANEATRAWAEGALQDVGQRMLQLQAQIQGGEFDDDPIQRDFLLGQLDAEEAAINKVKNATLEFNKVLGEDSTNAAENLLSMLNRLGVNGFQGIEANIQSLNGAFFNWMATLNLSEKQMENAVRKWVQLMALAAQAVQLFNIAQSFKNFSFKLGGIDVGNIIGGALEGVVGGIDQQIAKLIKQINAIGSGGAGTSPPSSISGSSGSKPSRTVDTLYLTEEQAAFSNDPRALIKQAYQDALKLQAQIPGEEKRNRRNTVIVFDELNRIFKARGVSEELLRRALDNLTGEMEKANSKADTIRRIRVGAGDFSAIANVPVNSATGVSVGANNQINVTFNLNGTNLTPAQFAKFADMIGAEIARRLG